MEVHILSSKFIKPSLPTPPQQQVYPFTFFDQIAPKLHVPLLYFYHGHGNRHEQLQKSLSETLTLYYPLAGRFGKDGLSVNCDDQGVLYLEAQVNVQLDEFLHESHKNMELLNDFFPTDFGEPTSPTTPLLAVQVTTFECGGLCLAVSISHRVADGYNGCKFTQDWATMSRAGIHEPCFERSTVNVFPTRNLDGVKLKPPPPMKTGVKFITKKFLYDEAAISALKATVTAGSGGIRLQPTRVEVVTASIWRALILGARAKHGHFRASVMSLTMNLRGKTAVPIPSNAFGNHYIEFPIKFSPSPNENKMELHDLAVLMRVTVKAVASGVAKASNGDELFTMIINHMKEVREDMNDDEVEFYWLTSLCRFPQYGEDFGWGEPCLVSGDSVPANCVALRDTKCGTGVEAKVSLPEMDMVYFESDPLILEVTSSLNGHVTP